MKLLIVTQAVDLDDPVLGFFHRWIESFAAQTNRTEVVCLKEGRHTLPSNVRVHSLGKERGRVARFVYIIRFLSTLVRVHGTYDSVFVHMNEEYVLIAGPVWRLLGKKVVLWRNHKKGSWFTNVAAFFSNAVCYTSPEAYTVRFSNAVKMPIGIDTDLFTPAAPAREKSLLMLGRIDPVKKTDLFIEALLELSKQGVSFNAAVCGDPTIPGDPFALKLMEKAEPLVRTGQIVFYPSVRNVETPTMYRAHAIYVNVTPSGSFDKTIGEAMACGAVVVCANDAVAEVVPPELMVKELTPSAVARSIQAALSLSQSERQELAERSRSFIQQNHSLSLLTTRLNELLIS